MNKKTIQASIIGLTLTAIVSGGATYYLSTQNIDNIKTAETIEIENLKSGLEAYKIETNTAQSIADYFYGKGKKNKLGNVYLIPQEKSLWIQACNEAKEEIRGVEYVNWGAIENIEQFLAKCNYVIDKAGALKALVK